MAPTAMLAVLALSFSMGQQMPAAKRSRIRTRPVFHAVAAYVCNEHFSALRRTPGTGGAIIERLRIGRLAAILDRRRMSTGAWYYRVATTRRTRGWIDAAALVSPGRIGDEHRLLGLIKVAEGFTRLELCHLMRRHFRPSPDRAEALMIMGDEAEEAARALTTAARRRKIEDRWAAAGRSREDVYLNFEMLDRFNRLGVHFRFEPESERYSYDGEIYRELTRTPVDPALREKADRRLRALNSILP